MAKAGAPTKMTEDTLTKLKTAFLMGCPDDEACAYAEINPLTLYRYQDKNPEYVTKKETWKKNPFLKARATVYNKLDKGYMAQWFLERKKKDEFAERQELTGKEGQPLGLAALIEKISKEDEDNAKRKTNSSTGSR